MKKFAFAVMLFASGILCAVELGKVELRGAVRTEGIIHFNGSAEAVIPNSSSININDQGLTLLVTLKPRDAGTTQPQPESLDMYVFKKDHFLFGRLGNRLYANFHDGKSYCGHTLSLTIPPAGKWSQAAAVFEAYDNSAHGDRGYLVSIYLNGKRYAQKKFREKYPAPNSNPVTIGKGWGGPWHYRGDIGEVKLIKRPLGEGEIAQAFQKNKFVDKDALLGEKAWGISEKEWVSRVLERSGRKAPGKVLPLWKKNKFESTAAFFKSAPHGIRLITADQLFLLIDTNPDAGHPLLGIYDRKGRYDIGDNDLFGWQLSAYSGKQRKEISSAKSSGKAVVTSDGFQAIWQFTKPFKAEVVAKFTVSGSQTAASLQVKNQSADTKLMQVVFPKMTLHRIAENDTLLFPFMCGVEVNDPTVKRFRYGQAGIYPSGKISMQYSGYYGDGRGIYFAFEDPQARTKSYFVVGRNNTLDTQWSHPVTLNDGAGGNSFISPGRAVLRLCGADWYSVTACYREFAETSNWWLKELPRKKTPEWYRSSLMRMSYYVPKEKQGFYDTIRELRYLRKYFDIPISLMLYHWDDKSKGHWPHFQMKKSLIPILHQLAAEGIFIEPYVNPRLWKQLDGPYGKSDWLYSETGKKYAAKDVGMKIPFERYSDGDFSIMCPCVEAWRKKHMSVLKAIAPHVQSFYMDEVGTADPIVCFDPSHGHALNDASAWIDQGYRPLISEVRKNFPDLPLNTEEIADPYVALFDAALVWRWTFAGQVPAFQAVYSGRIQFAGRTAQPDRGDPRSNLVKLAVMLVNAEQIGRVTPPAFSEADDFRMMTKKMLHLRRALSPYFNTGKMLAPIRYIEPPAPDTRVWGTFHVPQTITMPAIISNSYDTADVLMYVFVNPSEKTVSAVPDLGQGELFRCAEGRDKVEKIPASAPVVLAPFATEVRFSRKAPAEAVQPVMKKVVSFDRGIPLVSLLLGRKEKEIAPERGVMMRPGDVSWYYRCINVKTHFGHIVAGAIISYGIVDFGKDPVDTLILTAGVSKTFKGARIEVITAPDTNPENCLGSFIMPDTGGFDALRDFPVKLSRPLTGKHRIMVRFSRNGSCNFVGWKF